MTEKTSDDSTPEVNKEEELDDEALFGDIGGLFGDPQNCHGDMQHPFVYVWPKPLDDDDISLYTNPALISNWAFFDTSSAGTFFNVLVNFLSFLKS